MKFGYFTLSDNNYRNNDRSPNQCVADILEQALYAEELGMHSVWIGEHHFSTLGVNSSPEVLLAYIAAKTRRVRLAPAVNVLPLHNPVLVAEQWATLDLFSDGRVDFATGRGYDRREYEPLGANFEENAAIFAEGVEIVHRLWSERGPITHKGKHYAFEDIYVTPAPMQQPIPIYVASFSKPSIELAARLGLGLVVAAGQASAMHGSLAATAQVYRDACAAVGRKPGRLITSYFIHFADTPARGTRRARAAAPLSSGMHLAGIPRRSEDRAGELPLFRDHPEPLSDHEAGGLHRQRRADRLVGADRRHLEDEGRARRLRRGDPLLQSRPEAAHAVKDEMARFMAEVAPTFSG